jgi:Zn-dependent protease/CBS domain-containing protein
MKASFRLLRISGIDIGIHYSWLLIFILIAWSLAQGYFPQAYPGWTVVTYWVTGVIASLMLFISVLLHELAHSLVAKARGLPVSSITLFIFGGVSNLEKEPEKPSTEFTMAIVGPLSSLIIGGIFWGLLQVLTKQTSPVAAMLHYLALINVILAAFNMLPGFPLDGGRVLRSILWGTMKDLKKATNIAATVGQAFGWAMIALGVFWLFTGNFIGGLWIAFIGWFLSSAAGASRRQLTLQEHLAGVAAKEAMNPNPVTVDQGTSVDEVVRNVFYQGRGRAAPVMQGEKLVGIVTIDDVKKLSDDRWSQTPVVNIMTHVPLYSVAPEDDLNTALKLIAQHDINQVVVLRQGQLIGLLSRADIIRYLQVSQELGLKAHMGRKAKR